MKRKINPMEYLDLNNWAKTFPKFIEAIGKEESLKTSDVVFTFAKSTKNKFKFRFSTMAKVHIYALYLMKTKSTQYKYETRMIYNNREEFDKYINNTLGSLKDKLMQMKKTRNHLSGYEKLTELKIKDEPLFSIEGYKSHRILYLPRFQYDSVYLESLLFHYQDDPREEFDEILFNVVNNINPRKNHEINEDKLNEVVKQMLSGII